LSAASRQTFVVEELSKYISLKEDYLLNYISSVLSNLYPHYTSIANGRQRAVLKNSGMPSGAGNPQLSLQFLKTVL